MLLKMIKDDDVQNVIAKEMETVRVAFQIIANGEKAPQLLSVC